jgi:hypothetical protein
MQFHSFAKQETFTVRPSFKSIEHGIVSYTKPLRAAFVNHRFDSEAAQKSLGWTDEEREQVEQHLLSHYKLGKTRGFYVLDAYMRPTTQAPEPATVVDPGKIQCLFVIPTSEGDERCDKPAVEGGIYCEAHVKGAALAEAV